MLTALILVAVLAITLAVLLIAQRQAASTANATLAIYERRYKGIIDVDGVITARQAELDALAKNLRARQVDFALREEQLGNDYKTKRDIYEQLLRELAVVEQDLEDISYGLYKPHFTYSSSDEFRQQLTQITDKQKALVRVGGGTFCPTNWTVEGSATKGKKMTRDNSKLMLRAFNGECDAATARVSWSNVNNMEARIQKAYEAINKLGETNHINITHPYLLLKLDELHLEFDLAQKLHEEKEEQRKIRDQMREEEKALRELEKARQDAEAEEIRYQKALDKAKSEVAAATGAQLDRLNERIAQLEASLLKAQEQKQRAISQAQLTRSGHVYIISNIGSFGDNVFKIGMTRRLEPLDRVHELGDASVPFEFDVHGMIYSEDAPTLENTLHRKLDDTRLNLLDKRSEFFQTSIEEIEKIIGAFNLKVELTKIAEAQEYRATMSIRKAREQEAAGLAVTPMNSIDIKLSQFPVSLS